ncbi:hypothetical protein GCM10022377_10210 [Zhihengliuella alba]|uniref:Phage tail protein n=1 Tax=Zhihengliuella alba TaxID=547018 RepID=A0ABP7D4H4_9MICC
MAEIPSTPADGNVRVVFVPTIADPTAPTVTELGAGTAVDLSCYITGGGLAATVDEQSIADERLCSVQVFEQPGRSSNSLELTYIDNTNSPNAATDNKAVDTLVRGTTGYVVIRRGIAYEDAFAASQKVRVYPTEAGAYRPNAPEANSVLTATTKMFVTGEVKDATVAI